jgi:hypothetical protein
LRDGGGGDGDGLQLRWKTIDSNSNLRMRTDQLLVVETEELNQLLARLSFQQIPPL